MRSALSRSEPEPFDGEPQTEREWRMYFSWRMKRVEDRIDGIFKAVVTIAVGLCIGVGVYILTVVVATGGGG